MESAKSNVVTCSNVPPSPEAKSVNNALLMELNNYVWTNYDCDVIVYFSYSNDWQT